MENDQHLTFNERVLSALLHGNLLEMDASINRKVAADAARQIITTQHFAVISPSRDIVGAHHGLRAGASDKDKAAAEDALRRTSHAAENHGHGLLGHPRHAENVQRYHEDYNLAANTALGERLRAGGHQFVRAIGGYREAGSTKPGVATEGSFVVHGKASGSTMTRDGAIMLGHSLAQDSILYSGPETRHIPVEYQLHYHDDGSPLVGKYSERQVFDPHRVRTVTPGMVRAASSGSVAFTHAYNPNGDILRHALPAQDINQVAFKLLPKTARHTWMDVPH